MSTDTLHKIGVGESNGDVIFVFRTPPSGQNYFQADFKTVIVANNL
jgi:hypothetical protein